MIEPEPAADFIDLDATPADAAFEPILDEPDEPVGYDGPVDIDRAAARRRHDEASRANDKVRSEAASLRATMADPGAVDRIIQVELGSRPTSEAAAAVWDAKSREIVKGMGVAVEESFSREAAADADMVELARERQSGTREKYQDFDTVLSAASISPTNPDTIRMILSHPKSADLCYHLAREPDAVRQLNAMHPSEAAYAIGKAAAALVNPAAAAPKATPVRDRSDPERMTMAEYSAWRKRGGGGK